MNNIFKNKSSLFLSGIALILLLSGVYLWTQQNRINVTQAYDIAYGKALKSCVDQANGKKLDCKEMKLLLSEELNSSLFSLDEFRKFTFTCGTYPNDFSKTVYLDLKGGELPDPNE